MFVQGFGEVLTDVMTVNPAIADIPSASSILDTSNFTFQAVTFGKDAEGFAQHSHSVSAVQYIDGNSASGASGYDSGFLTVINWGSNLTSAVSAASSYVISATYSQFSSNYNSVPNDPSPLDTRLERGSTSSTNLSSYSSASALPDLGHYVNSILDNQLSSIWNKVGGFAPSDGGDYRFYDRSGDLVYEGSVSGYFNTHGIMDKNGYLTVSPSSVSELSPTSVNYFEKGSLGVSSESYPVSGGQMILKNYLYKGDAVTLAAFGSVKHVGVYCIDLKSMLSEGLTPPYNWNHLNNNRKYKLVAKVTLLDNPLRHRDGLDQPGLGHWLAENSVILSLTFDFK